MRVNGPWRGLLCAAALAGLLVGCGGATASPSDVIADYNAGGIVDGQLDADPEVDVRHTLSDLEYAKPLMAIQQPADLQQFIASTNAYIDQNFLGIQQPQTPGPTGLADIPRVDVPTWAVVTAVGAGLLALGGIGSAFYRRARRRVA